WTRRGRREAPGRAAGAGTPRRRRSVGQPATCPRRSRHT
ncbi:MAG: hypothetical protein AVDCRST_MAG49-4546, partial [uncultured Thermomicrobiales bacterium]